MPATTPTPAPRNNPIQNIFNLISGKRPRSMVQTRSQNRKNQRIGEPTQSCESICTNPYKINVRNSEKILGFEKINRHQADRGSEKLEKQVTLLENNRLEEYTIERETDRNIVGSIYKGKVRNIEPGIKAMFVDIGFEKMRSCSSGMPSRRRSTAASKPSIVLAKTRRKKPHASLIKMCRISTLWVRISSCR